MTLIIDGEFVQDPWRAATSEADSSERLLIAVEELATVSIDQRSQRIGVEIENTTNVDVLGRYLESLDMIIIRFPSTFDGRGFSLARQLRDAGFQGQIRACGTLIVDQYSQLLSCGFDAVEIPDEIAVRQPEPLWRAETERFAVRLHENPRSGSLAGREREPDEQAA